MKKKKKIDNDHVLKTMIPKLAALRRMRVVRRCQLFHCNAPQNLADHSHGVALLAMMICDDINTAPGQDGRANAELAMRAALVHDTDELYTGDIPWPIKNSHGLGGGINESAIAWREGLWGDFHHWTRDLLYDGLIDDPARGSNQTDRLTLQVVRIADMLELSLYCWDEAIAGNTTLAGLWGESIRIAHQYRRVLADEHNVVAFLAWAINLCAERAYTDFKLGQRKDSLWDSVNNKLSPPLFASPAPLPDEYMWGGKHDPYYGVTEGEATEE